MKFEELKELDEIEQLAIDVSSMISVTKNSCEINDYFGEEAVLSHALSIQNEVIEKNINLSISSLQ